MGDINCHKDELKTIPNHSEKVEEEVLKMMIEKWFNKYGELPYSKSNIKEEYYDKIKISDSIRRFTTD